MRTGLPTRMRLAACVVAAAFATTACGSALSRKELLTANLEAFRPSAGQALAGGAEHPASPAHEQLGADAAAGAIPGLPSAPAPGAVGASGPSPGGSTGGLRTQPGGAGGLRTQPGGTGATGASSVSQGSTAGPSDVTAGPATPGAPTPGQPSAGPTGAMGEVRLGSIGAGSGPIGAAMRSFVDGAKAWVSDVNSRGGVNGHPVRLLVVDDGGDPSAALALAKRLVEQDKIHAFYATHAPATEQAYVGYAEEKQVPIIGTCGCSNVVDSSPMIFHVGPGAPAGASWAHILPFTSLSDKRKVALLYCREVSVCPLLADGVKKAAKPAGYEVVYEGQISLAQPDMTAEMISARNAGADVVVTIADNATTIRVARSAHRQGYNPLLSTQHAANEDTFLQTGGDEVEGALVAAVVPDYANSPKLADYRTAMDRYVPGGRKGSFSAQTWAAGKLIEIAGKALGEGPTSAQLLDGLYALRGETLGSLVPPMTFAKGQGHGDVNQCIIPARVEHGKFVYPFGDRFSCPPGFKPAGS